MTHVKTQHLLIKKAGHHRQPRNADAFQNLGGGDEFTTTDSTGDADALVTPGIKFLFWSVSDGNQGITSEDPTLTYPVFGAHLTVTGWYVEEGGTGPGGPGYLIDAFSTNVGTFVDDDFVEVTSDPSLTEQANVAGFIPTTTAQAAEAFAAISGEEFNRWEYASSATGRDAKFDQGSGGFAISFFEEVAGGGTAPIGKVRVPALGVKIIGTPGDGGFFIIRPGGGGGPVGPWEPKILKLLGVLQSAKQVRGGRLAGARLDKASAKAISDAAQAIVNEANKSLG